MSLFLFSKVESLFNYQKRSRVSFPLHLHRSIEFVLVTDGVLNMCICGKEYIIPKGYGVFIEPYEPHSFNSKEENDTIIIEVSLNLCESFSTYIAEYSVVDRRVRYSAEMLAYLETLLPWPKASEISQIIARTVSAVLTEAFLEHCEFSVRQNGKRDSVFDALRYISDNFRKEISIESVADALGLNADSLSRKFSVTVGMTIPEYIRYLRVCHSATLLFNGSSVAEAAFNSGFSSLRTFNRNFKQIIGVAPTEYLRSPKTDRVMLVQ
ncbi:MAG: helix-turn-helix domain-containing protein [Ruminococcaceae bacterium]|nr:helix-turn-helix domain-containing protein [Oscillospiraceae bacterium]